MMDRQRRQPDAAMQRREGDANMRGRRRSSWTVNAWSPAPSSIAANRRPAGPRRFAPTEHLAPEAVAAYVDGELRSTAHLRATQHLAMCPECVAAVDAQLAARTRLRQSGSMPIPTGLLGALSQIPTREYDIPERRPDHPGGADHPRGIVGELGAAGRMPRRWGR
ncbi:MAG: zf-HC2 domain-containing protein [Gordonia sp. (in: high G+C Gram-positive bacteria)]